VLLVDEGNEAVLAEFTAGPGNIHLLPGEALDAHLREIRERLPLTPDRIGIGLAGVRSEAIASASPPRWDANGREQWQG
jgi:N-acetylglucosamine kinase-like BadF-type ATPase